MFCCYTLDAKLVTDKYDISSSTPVACSADYDCLMGFEKYDVQKVVQIVRRTPLIALSVLLIIE